MKNLSLQTRMIIAFAAFSVSITLVYWSLLFGMLLMSEDDIFNRQLNIELNRQLEFYSEHQQFDHLPNNMHIYDEESLKGHPLSDKIIRMKLGLNELEKFDTHVAIALIPESDRRIYLIYSVENQEIDEATMHMFMLICLITSIIVSAAGILIGAYVGIRAAQPIVKLDQRVQSLKDEVEFGETASFGDDEVGRLARSFAHSYERSQQFLEREKRFTREVSHELRTPTAVIQGALDILEIQPDNPKAIGRIRRAGRDIQELIDTFLTLGREENLSLSSDTLDIETVIYTVIEQHAEASKVPIRFELHSNPQLKVLPPVFAILLDNLISNAVRFTQQGSINISVKQDHMSISDTGCGFNEDTLSQIGQPYLDSEKGFGLGLSIVKRICQQFSWSLQISSTPDKGSCICINFDGEKPLKI